ncbi:hypothetical protein F5Y10DRAFT_293461 [Nemania abortiva]|nr:hypothetical protein F5Y10DRAFT_293461 [Nemania abortiva]
MREMREPPGHGWNYDPITGERLPHSNSRARYRRAAGTAQHYYIQYGPSLSSLADRDEEIIPVSRARPRSPRVVRTQHRSTMCSNLTSHLAHLAISGPHHAPGSSESRVQSTTSRTTARLRRQRAASEGSSDRTLLNSPAPPPHWATTENDQRSSDQVIENTPTQETVRPERAVEEQPIPSIEEPTQGIGATEVNPAEFMASSWLSIVTLLSESPRSERYFEDGTPPDEPADPLDFCTATWDPHWHHYRSTPPPP